VSAPVWVAALLVAQVASAAPRRFALIVGSNEGDASEAVLRYGERDAQRVREVLTELAGVQRGDVLALVRPSADELAQAVRELGRRLQREAASSDQLLVYFSGHADEESLHLSGSRWPLAELSRFVRDAPVDMALLVVDACRSGAIAGLKGLAPVQQVSLRVPQDVRGRVVISSSGPDEYALESDSVGGSYFTHFWVSGLRGAADSSRDGRVTLQEAYQYAYARTIESTLLTRVGVQHPSYHVDLKGHGELVITEPGGADAQLILEAQGPSEWTVLGVGGSLSVGSLVTPRGPVTLAVPSGSHRVRVQRSGGSLEGWFHIPARGALRVTEADLRWVPDDRIAVRGGPSVRVGAAGALRTPVVRGVSLLPGAQVWGSLLRSGWGPLNLVTAQLEAGWGRSIGDVAFRHAEYSALVLIGRSWAVGPLGVDALVGPGAVLVHQWKLSDGQSQLGVQPHLRVQAGVSMALGQRFSLQLTIGGGPALVRKVQGRELAFTGGAALGLARFF
jgi:hypothetical protein